MKSGNVIRVAIVEDDARLRAVLTEVLASASDFTCVGVFPSGKSAIAKLPDSNPDIVIQDINLPDMSGVDCIAELSPRMPQTQFIVLTVYQDRDTIFKALAAGAHGYLVKPVKRDHLLGSLREIHSGGVPMSPNIAHQLIEFFRPPNPKSSSTVEVEPGLGAREQQVLDFLVSGLSYKEIAGELQITTSTVGTYVRRIYEKLHLRSRREIIAAREQGTLFSKLREKAGTFVPKSGKY